MAFFPIINFRLHLPSFYSRKITGSAFTQCLPPQPIISIYIDESRYSHATNGVALGGRPRGEPCTVRWYSPSLRCAAADHPIQVVPELVVILECRTTITPTPLRLLVPWNMSLKPPPTMRLASRRGVGLGLETWRCETCLERCVERERIEGNAKDAAVSLRGPAWRKEPEKG